MGKILAAVMLGLAALPALAGVGNVSPFSATSLRHFTYNTQTQQMSPGARGSRAVGTVYQDFTTIGSVLNAGTTSAFPRPVGDDIHAIGSGTMTSFTFAAFVPSATAGGAPQTSGAVTFNFHTNTASDGATPPFPTTPGFFSTTMVIPTGAASFAVTGLSVPVGTDFWIEQDWSGNGTKAGGPILVSSGGTIGYSHSIYAQTSLLWTLATTFGGVLHTDFFYAVNVIPEPAGIGLLALGGLLVLRRRK